MIPFAAVLLAGGQSRRMGRDKALLPLADGRLLWQRQLAVLKELTPAELFISGPSREGFPPDVALLADDTPGLGPLAGITAALKVIRSPLLVVLAIDLPMMTTAFLRGLLGESVIGLLARGIVPQMDNGFFEPLAAVYPRTAQAVARESMSGEDRSLQTFVHRLTAIGAAAPHPISALETGLFANWNQPENMTRLD